MEKELIDKINKSMDEKFVGNIIFTDDELMILYDDVGDMLRRVSEEYSKEISPLYYNKLFVALVNIAKEWASEEDAFFDFVYKRLSIENGNGKVYTQIINAIKSLYLHNKIFLFKSFTKKYYASICSNAFAPKTSTFAFFDICWEVYCNDLDQQYVKDDQIIEVIADSLKNKFSIEKNEDIDFKLGSKTYALKAGIRGLALDEKERLIELLNLTIEGINSLFNNEIYVVDNYYKKLLKEWWTKKEKNFGANIIKQRERENTPIYDYSKIAPRYEMKDSSVILKIPSIGLKNDLFTEPYFELYIDEKLVKKDELYIKGSNLLMHTRSYDIDISDYNLSNVSLKIIHYNKEIYFSKKTLNRDFVLFNSKGREITFTECNIGIYFLFVPDFNVISQYPNDIEKISQGIYSLNTIEGDILQSKNRTIYFFTENTYRDIRFYCNKVGSTFFRCNNEDYNIVDGDLYVDVSKSLKPQNYGIKYGTTTFKLVDFEFAEIDDKFRYCVSNIFSEGEAQNISIFKYTDNKTVITTDIIKFKNVEIKFDKDLYFGKDECGTVEFKTDSISKIEKFLISSEEIYIPVCNGQVVVKAPVLRWKIDDGDWKSFSESEPIWFRDIGNSSILYIDAPINKMINVGATNNEFVERFSNKLGFKIGEMIYREKEIGQENLLSFFGVVDNKERFLFADIYIKEIFLEEPFKITEDKKLIWNPYKFIGNKDAKFKFVITNKFNKEVDSFDLNLERKVINLDNIIDNYYTICLYLVKNFLTKNDFKLYEKEQLIGNEKIARENERRLFLLGKNLQIDRVYFANGKYSQKIDTFYVENIRYLEVHDNHQYYSGNIYFNREIITSQKRDGFKKYVKNSSTKYVKVYYKGFVKEYLNNVNDSNGEIIKINPVRIEFIDNNFCYICYGLNKYDTEFRCGGEFKLNSQKVGSHFINMHGTKISYFKYEVKNV